MQIGYPIIYTKCDQNIFVLKLAMPNKVMHMIEYDQIIHLMRKNRKIKVCYCKFRYASKAIIINAFKLLTGISNFNKAYNLTKIYNNFI